MSDGAEKPFRVLIAGGSVAGLTLANALERAGIDYVLLEKREIAPALGASISVLSHCARIFEQLGVWNALQKVTVPLVGARQHFNERGRMTEEKDVLGLVARKTGRPFLFVQRQVYLEILYNNIDDKTKVRSHTGVVSFTETADGVEVTTDSGEKISGSILVGADGVHSTVRGLLAEAAAKSDPARSKQLSGAFTANYRTLFGTSHNHFPGDEGKELLPNGVVQVVYYRDVSGVIATGVDGVVFWFLFEKLDKPTTTPNSPRYTNADAEASIAKHGHLSLGKGYTFKDLWETKINGGMVPMEEGVIPGSWNNGGRVVLIGDAVSKTTANTGLGGNTVVEAVCCLVNELVPLLKTSPNPTTSEVVDAFNRYEKKHRPRADTITSLSGMSTRLEAMDTWWLRVLRVVITWVPDSLKAKGYVSLLSPAPTFDFLPTPAPL